MAHRLSELATKYKQIADAIIGAGPLVNENLADLKVICERVCAIRERTSKHFGLSAGVVAPITDDEVRHLLEQPSVKAVNEELGIAGDGVKGPFADVIIQLVQLVMSNPRLLELLLSWLSKSATP